MIHLETSPRQSGKTTRMREYVIENHEKYNTIIIVGPTLNMVRGVLENLYDFTGPDLYKIICKKIKNTSWSNFDTSVRGLSFENTLYCFDEFDFFDNSSKLTYFENGYYCGTLNNSYQYNNLIDNMPQALKFMYL